jgi:HEPN domain-containing protein
MLCFHAQQAAEKSLKAVLLAHEVEFPRTHNLRVLRDLLPPTLAVVPEVEQAVELSDYATMARYPGAYEPVIEEEYREAIRLAEAVVTWARGLLT